MQAIPVKYSWPGISAEYTVTPVNEAHTKTMVIPSNRNEVGKGKVEAIIRRNWEGPKWEVNMD